MLVHNITIVNIVSSVVHHCHCVTKVKGIPVKQTHIQNRSKSHFTSLDSLLSLLVNGVIIPTGCMCFHLVPNFCLTV